MIFERSAAGNVRDIERVGISKVLVIVVVSVFCFIVSFMGLFIWKVNFNVILLLLFSWYRQFIIQLHKVDYKYPVILCDYLDSWFFCAMKKNLFNQVSPEALSIVVLLIRKGARENMKSLRSCREPYKGYTLENQAAAWRWECFLIL